MNYITSRLEEQRHKGDDGKSYWLARELYEVLGYSTYQKFDLLIKRSFDKAKKCGYHESDLFNHEVKMADIGSNATRKIGDYQLTILACKFIIECSNSKKEEIVEAKLYFSMQNDGIDCDINCRPLVSPDDKERIKAANLHYWEENTKKASQVYINKMGRLNVDTNKNEKLIESFYRDDSFLGNPSPHHIMYKLGKPLVSKDKERAYEFLIEYDIYEPSTGIYYGCKGLTLNGKHENNMKELNKEWESIRELTGKILSNIFPGKQFALRFKTTNNANNNTYWPFWITLYEEEDIVGVAVRTVRIIKEIFQKELKLLKSEECNVNISQLGEIVDKDAKISKLSTTKNMDDNSPDKTITAFTVEAYKDIQKKIGEENFDKVIKKMKGQKMIVEASDYYQKTWIVQSEGYSQQDFVQILKDTIEEQEKKCCWKYLERVFIKENHQTFFDCLRQAKNEATNHTKREKRKKI